MHASGFANASVTRTALVALVAASILATATDTKHYLPFVPALHLLPRWVTASTNPLQHPQLWRLATWQLAHVNSSELLFACLTLYKLRVVERLWGSRKFASCLIVSAAYTAVLTPLLLTVVTLLVPARFATAIYCPAGPTAILFSLLAQYHAAVPYTYRYKLATGSTGDSDGPADDQDEQQHGLLLTSKSSSYLLPLQLALAQAPWSLVSAATGWLVGYAWRGEVLPGAGWRIPVQLWSGKGSVVSGSGSNRMNNTAATASSVSTSVSGGMDALRGRLRAEQRGAGTADS